MMTAQCPHDYPDRYECPDCGPAQEEHDAEVRAALGLDRGPLVCPRNRHERRKLEAFLRKNPGMRPPR